MQPVVLAANRGSTRAAFCDDIDAEHAKLAYDDVIDNAGARLDVVIDMRDAALHL